MAAPTEAPPASDPAASSEFIRGIGPLAADLAGRRLHDRLGDLHRLGRHRAAGGAAGGRAPCCWSGSSPALMTVIGALAYAELAAMMPKAGGQYVFLREGLSPAAGFLYGWTLFAVIQTGTIAAVAVAFARFLERARARRSARTSSCRWDSSACPGRPTPSSSASRPSASWRSCSIAAPHRDQHPRRQARRGDPDGLQRGQGRRARGAGDLSASPSSGSPTSRPPTSPTSGAPATGRSR